MESEGFNDKLNQFSDNNFQDIDEGIKQICQIIKDEDLVNQSSKSNKNPLYDHVKSK